MLRIICFLVLLAPITVTLAAPISLTLSGNQVTFTNGNLSTTSALDRLVTVYWADTPDIWAARAWMELPPDADAITAKQSENRIDIEYSSFGRQPIKLKLCGTLDAVASEVRWTLSVRNNTKGTLVGVAGPILREITDLPDGVLYYPNRPGQILREPWKVLQEGTTSIAYPVPASMQYMAYTARRTGIALHVLDQDMVYKFLAFGGPEREMRFLQFPFLAPGQRWESPQIIWQALAGDWHKAADRYKNWFNTWSQKPQISPQVKRLPIFGGIVIRSRPEDDPYLRDVLKYQEFHTYDRALEECLRLGKAGFEGMHLVGWFGQGHDTTYPDYDPSPEMGGTDRLKALVDGMHEANILVTFYLNTRLANVKSPSFLANPNWQVLEGEGPKWREKYGNQEFQVMCPGARGFQEKMRDEVLRVARDYHGDGAQLDQVGAATTLLCFDRTHGHRTPATAWAEGFTQMLTQIRDSARGVNPEFWCWIEGAWEGAGQYIDASQGGYWPQHPQSENFPRMYRYTHPEHSMFGDPFTGSVPYWSPTDIHRAKRINDVVGPLFWTAKFMDDQGLIARSGAEALWFDAGDKVIVTFRNSTDEERNLTARLDLRRTKHTTAPKSARALAAGQDVVMSFENARLELTVPVPAKQIEAVLLEW